MRWYPTAAKVPGSLRIGLRRDACPAHAEASGRLEFLPHADPRDIPAFVTGLLTLALGISGPGVSGCERMRSILQQACSCA